MATTIMHICIAKEVNKYLKMDEKNLILGTIAPDLSHILHQNREISHFFENADTEIPSIEQFLKKYKEDLQNPFTMGYLIHLLADKYWLKNYVNFYLKKYCSNQNQKNLTYAALKNLLYNDNTNMNSYLIKKYEIDSNILPKQVDWMNTEITEIPLSSLNLVLDKVKFIMEESQEEKNIPFSSNEIEIYIENTVRYILKDLENLGFTQNEGISFESLT